MEHHPWDNTHKNHGERWHIWWTYLGYCESQMVKLRVEHHGFEAGWNCEAESCRPSKGCFGILLQKQSFDMKHYKWTMAMDICVIIKWSKKQWHKRICMHTRTHTHSRSIWHTRTHRLFSTAIFRALPTGGTPLTVALIGIHTWLAELLVKSPSVCTTWTRGCPCHFGEWVHKSIWFLDLQEQKLNRTLEE